MKVYAITNPDEDNRYTTIQQIASDPDKLNYYARDYIIWYKDWEDPIDINYADIFDIQKDNWKIWETKITIHDCSYIEGIISQEGNGILEIEYKKGKLIELKYWFNKEDYLKNPDLIKQ